MNDRFRMLPSYHYEDNTDGMLLKSAGKPLREYKIEGNSVQDGTPTLDNPIEIQSIGDLITSESDENYGKYKIPIIVSGENQEINETNIYLDEPLRKIGDYADYMEFKKGKVFRRVSVIDDSGEKTIDESFELLQTPTEEPIELPKIPTYKGTNIITVGTSLQPGAVNYQYYKGGK